MVVGRERHNETSSFPDDRGIRVGFLSRLPLAEVQQVRPFPGGLEAVQVNDEGAPTHEMGRGALQLRVTANGHDIALVTCHLKSELVTFPGHRFSPHDEGEGTPVAASLSTAAAPKW